MQNKIDLLIAYANKVALALSMKEHAINQRMIEEEGRIIYAIHMADPCCSFRKYCGPNGQYNSKEESSLCNKALLMVTAGGKISELLNMRGRLMVEKQFVFRRPLNREETKDQESLTVELPFQSYADIDTQIKAHKQKIKHFVVTNYRKCPREIAKMIKQLHLDPKEVKKWIQYNEKSERRLKLREEIIHLAVYQEVTYEEFKKIARRLYRTRLFRATDTWCVNYIRRFRLKHIIEIPERLLKK